MVHKLVNIYTKLKRDLLCNTCFYGLRGRQTQVPPRAAHTLATPLARVKERSPKQNTVPRLQSNIFAPPPALNLRCSSAEQARRCSRNEGRDRTAKSRNENSRSSLQQVALY